MRAHLRNYPAVQAVTGKIARLRAWWSARNSAGSPKQPTVHQSVEVGSEAPIRTKSEDLLIHLSDPADNKPGDRDKFDPALDEGTVEAMKALWVKIIRAHAAADVALMAEDDLVSLLYRWRDYAKSNEEPRRWMAEAIKDDEDFAKIVSAMMSTGKSHSVRDRVTKVHKMFSREAVEDFIGLDEAQVRCDAINPARFPDHEDSLCTLKRHLDAWRENEGDLLYM